ncbi:alpha/beta fold hydrolase [Ectothiorhodospiraceae bacterium WFHF3C12]|nr:alpha/beta fold hydrolase [Ectothiorhodospiraceae bacterium WFHF3C12]
MADDSTTRQEVTERWLRAGDGARFRVTAIESPTGDRRAPIIYLPGMFSTRAFWRSERGIGLAAFLADRGHPGLIVERRKADCGARAGLEEHLRLDLPVAQATAEANWGRPAFWMGHSFGGVLAARACASYLDPERVRGLVLFAAQFEVGKRPLHPPLSWLVMAMTRALGRFPASRIGLGPSDEPPAAMADAVRIVTRGRRNPGMRDALAGITAPVLAISGTADEVDPAPGCERFIGHFASTDRRFVRAGRDHGFSHDFGHPDIVASKAAAAEIWPLVAQWLSDHDD